MNKRTPTTPTNVKSIPTIDKKSFLSRRRVTPKWKTFPQIKLSISLRERASRSRHSLLKEKKDDWRSWVKRTSTQRRALNLKDQHPKSRHFLSTKRKHLNIRGKENKHTKMFPRPGSSTFQVKTFGFNEKEISEDPGRRKKHTNLPSNPQYQTFKSRLSLSNEKETYNCPRRREKAPKLCLQP